MRSKNSECGIYCIENVSNGKKYVGFSVDIHRRFVTHKKLLKNGKHTNKHLQCAYNKYGEDSFLYTIIQYLPENNDILCDFEVYWIVYFNSFIEEDGYNLTMGGEGICLKKHSEETKKLLSEKLKGKPSAAKGKTMSQDQKNKISASNKGKPKSKEHIQASVNAKAKKRGGASLRYKNGEKKKTKNTPIRSKSGYRGVFSTANPNIWRARIEYKTKKYSLGYFDTKEDAALAYNKKAIELLGENAKLNIINNEEKN